MKLQIKDERLKNQMTQNEVAIRAGLSLSYFNMIENGNRRPSVENAKKIAAVLGIDWQLFYEEEAG